MSVNVYVFGLGHIGLPMAVWFALHGYTVIGIDTNPQVIIEIIDGTINIEESYQNQPISQLAQDLIQKKSLRVSTEFTRLDSVPSIFVVAVGIAEKAGEQELAPIHSVLEALTPHLVPEDLLLLRTTLIPGTIDQFVIPWFEKLPVPIQIAYCPETFMETRAFVELESNPVIVAGLDEASVKAAEKFLNSLSPAPIYKASNFKTAEMVKVIQNIYRDVNIALVNEISAAAYVLGVNIYELITLANTHPRVALLQPGPGVGGYCLPNALSYLQKALDQNKCPLILMNTARKLNTERPRRIVELISDALEENGKALTCSKVAVIGLAMKDYCADCRNSPALEIVSLLINAGATIQAYDPLLPATWDFQVQSLQECIKDADCLVILAHQEGIRFEREQLEFLLAKPLLVVDTRNVFPDYPDIQIYRP